ncbi:hypothetical protein D9M73_185720 [compost metagenome]
MVVRSAPSPHCASCSASMMLNLLSSVTWILISGVEISFGKVANNSSAEDFSLLRISSNRAAL